MLKRNWKLIAGIEDVLVRQMLIQVSVENTLTDALAIQYPLAFRPDEGEKKLRLTVQDLIILAHDMRPWDFKSMMEEEALPYEGFEFQGRCCGTTPNVSYQRGHEATDETIKCFWRTTMRLGEMVGYNGGTYFLIASAFVEGNAAMPDRHGLILVSELDLRA